MESPVPHPTPPTCQDQDLRVTEEVIELIDLLAAAEPRLHLTTAADLRDTCDGYRPQPSSTA